MNIVNKIDKKNGNKLYPGLVIKMQSDFYIVCWGHSTIAPFFLLHALSGVCEKVCFKTLDDLYSHYSELGEITIINGAELVV
jgi:hypothetical protein